MSMFTTHSLFRISLQFNCTYIESRQKFKFILSHYASKPIINKKQYTSCLTSLSRFPFLILSSSIHSSITFHVFHSFVRSSPTSISSFSFSVTDINSNFTKNNIVKSIEGKKIEKKEREYNSNFL